MKIKLVSDLHLEFADINIVNDNEYDVLILAGDILVAEDLYNHPEPEIPYPPEIIKTLGSRQAAAQRFRDFLKRVSFQFPNVIYVAGNHEFYHGKWNKTLEVLGNECAKFPNVYFLERGYKKIGDVNFIGGTLWTDLNKADPLTSHALRDMMNDYRVIRHDYDGYRLVRPEDSYKRHKDTLGYIKSVIAERGDEKFVVVGHHSPSFQSVHEQYRHEHLMNGGYHSDLSEFILDHPQIKLWVHGHTHHCFDYVIGETRIVCNPRGYQSDRGWGEDTGWNPSIILEV